MTIPTVEFQEPAPVPEVAAEVPGQLAMDPDAPTEEAPYGWTTDPATGIRRPKKTTGRRRTTASTPPPAPGATPSLEELKAQGKPKKAAEDVAPAHQHAKISFLKGTPKPKPEPAPVPPFRAGPIAKGVNKLYRRAGKIVRTWDPALGAGIIACTVKDEDDEEGDKSTVGEAWEELARINPRIRAFLARAVAGGAWGSLFMAHAPILLAIAMKDSVQRRLPIMRILGALLTDEDDQGEEYPSDLSASMGGMNPEDLAQMMQFAQGMMGQMGMGIPRGMNDARGDEGVNEVFIQAEAG
jgi:hypothetical protein